MKKNLFTCFLALLCLYGSTGTAQVADSPLPTPGADILHRFSGPDRGGETRSDTFHRNTPHEIDGGPWPVSLSNPWSVSRLLTEDRGQCKETATSAQKPPRSDVHETAVVGELGQSLDCTSSSFSLVDQHLDPGAGEGTSHPLPAPVTVFAHQHIGGPETIQKTSDRERLGSCVACAEHWSYESSEYRSKVAERSRSRVAERSRSRVDTTDSAGQGSASSSAQVGEGMLYIEIDSPKPPDTLWITYWEHLLEDSKPVTPGVSYPLVGENGSFFEGSMHQKVFTSVPPQTVPKGFFSLKTGEGELISHWFFSRGDRVRMRVDLSSGAVLFGGPQGGFYRTQYLLDRIIAEGRFNSDPVLIAGSRETVFADSISRSRYQRALDNPDDLYTSIKVVVPTDDGWDHLNSYLKEPTADHPGWELLEEKKGSLTESEYQRLRAKLKGEILTGAVRKALQVADLLKEDPEKGRVFMEWAESLELKEETESHPLLVQSVTSLQRLESRITGTRFLESLEGYSPQLGDEMIAYYILNNFNRLGDRLPAILDEGLALVRTPWIRERLEALRDIQEAGFVSEGLFDQNGVPVDFRDYGGKTIFIHFWISGCKFCKDEYETVLKPLEEAVKNNPDILLVTVNADPGSETWKSSLASDMYTSPGFLNLHASKENGVLSRYSIQTFPQKIVLGPDTGIKLQSIDRMDADGLIHLLDGIQHQASPTFSPPQTLPL